jgi:hypothetical protein
MVIGSPVQRGTTVVAKAVEPLAGEPPQLPSWLLNGSAFRLKFDHFQFPKLPLPPGISPPLQVAPVSACAPDAPAVTTSPPVASAIPPTTESLSAWWTAKAKAAGPGLLFAKESLHLIDVTGNMSHAAVVGKLNLIGVPSNSVDRVADRALELLHGKGVDCLLVGCAAGGATYAVLGAVSPKMSSNKKLAVSAAVLLVVASLWATFAQRPDPYVGKWKLDVMASQFQGPEIPRGAVESISEARGALQVAKTISSADGKQIKSIYSVEADGKEHAGQTPSSAILAKRDKDRLDMSIRESGVEILHEDRSLSADRRQMTVTVLGHFPDGRAYRDVEVYEREKE